MDHETPWTSDAWIQQTIRMLDSFRQFLNEPLIPNELADPMQRAQQLFELDAVVLAHGTEKDPIFCYGNLAALRLWEIDLATLLTMPSRKSAEPVERTDRSQMLEQGLERGYIQDYEGVRISATGRRFHARNATIWNVLDESGVRVGQAATFSEWEYKDD